MLVGMVDVAAVGVASPNEVEGKSHGESAIGQGEAIIGRAWVGVLTFLVIVSEAHAIGDDEVAISLVVGQ